MKTLGPLLSCALIAYAGMHSESHAGLLEETTQYQCDGQYEKSGSVTKGKLFLQLSLYRSVVSLWSKSDGDLRIEEHTDTLGRTYVTHGYYDEIQVIGNIVRIKQKEKIVGDFSKLGNQIALQTVNGTFTGSCKTRN